MLKYNNQVSPKECDNISGIRQFIKPHNLETQSQWYAIYTKSRFEKKVNHLLQLNGFKTFLPLIKTKRIWSDRIKNVQVPLLPGYLFVKTRRSKFPLIYSYPGFVRVISSEGLPCVIKESEIDLLQRVISNEIEIEVTSYCNIGDRVKILNGPLSEKEGRVIKKAGKRKVVLNLEGIQQAISIEVCASQIEKVRM